MRSFPSQSAIKSPPIMEEEESTQDPDFYDSASSSVSEEEEFEEEFEEQDLADHGPASTVSFEPIPSTKDATEEPMGQVATAPELIVIPATPSVERFVDSNSTPTPTSPAVLPVTSTSSPHSSPNKEQPVGFYIGADLPSPSSEQLVLLNNVLHNGQVGTEEDQGSLPKENSAATWLSSLLERGEKGGSPGEQEVDARPGWSQEPQVSERPTNLNLDLVQFKGG
ncbi:hypothetical protein EGW08_022410, partial [Elysia chlorotica]